jgi:streptogramin lyase
VDTIDVGNGPTAITASGDGLWVANATDSTVVRLDARSGKLAIDARTGQPAKPTGVAAKPVALVADDDGLWVASEDGAAVSHLDPVTGVTLGSPIPLAARPSALGLDPESVWVAAADGTVTRIERQTNRVTATIDIGGALDALVIIDDSVWIGDREGYVHRLDRADPSSSPAKIATVSSVGALAIVEGDIWAATQASVASHSGGTLRIAEGFRSDTDPLGNPYSNVSLLEADAGSASRSSDRSWAPMPA